MAHEKLKAAALFVSILAVVGGVCCVLVHVSLTRAHPPLVQPVVGLIVQSAVAGFTVFRVEDRKSESAPVWNEERELDVGK
jgi:hypothetical protein